MYNVAEAEMSSSKWLLILFSIISLLLVFAHEKRTACYIYDYNSKGCESFSKLILPVDESVRDYKDEVFASRVVTTNILNGPLVPSNSPKIAFLFLTPGPLPLQLLWDKFFQVCTFSNYIFLSFPFLFASNYIFIFLTITNC